MHPQDPQKLQIEFTWRAYLRGLSLLLIFFVIARLAFVIGLILVAVLLAVTMEKFIEHLVKLGVKRHYAFGCLLVSAVTLLLLGLVLVVPTLFVQIQAVSEKLPEIRSEILAQLPKGHITQELEKLWANPEKLIGNWGDRLLLLGTFLTEAASAVVIIFTFAFYLLLDGKRSFEWVISFFQHENQRKLKETATEVKKIISGYVAGQLITSALAFVFTSGLLLLLDVPAWLMLALLAAALDMVPVVGFLITMVAVGVLALSVSWSTAWWACLMIVFYQGVENYLISPRVYGSTLRLSNLAVLVAFACGGLLGGPLGVVLALPVAAAYPPIERIWLKRYLGEEVLAKHKKLGHPLEH